MRAPLVAKLIALALVSQSAYRWKLELVRVGRAALGKLEEK